MRVNDEITGDQVRLIGDGREQIGVMPLAEAMQRAQDEDFDLVEISPNAAPPVCRLMDFGKFKYQEQKRLTDQRKKAHGHELKQMRIKTFRIDPHDLGIKLRKSRAFLEEGHRLLITLMFRARENRHVNLGEKLLLEGVAGGLEDIAKIESMPRKDGRRMIMTLAPLPNLESILKSRAAKQAASEAAELAGETLDEDSAPLDDATSEAASTEVAPTADESPSDVAPKRDDTKTDTDTEVAEADGATENGEEE